MSEVLVSQPSMDQLGASVKRLVTTLPTGTVVLEGLTESLEVFQLTTRRQKSGAVDLFVQPGDRYVHPQMLSRCELTQILGNFSLRT